MYFNLLLFFFTTDYTKNTAFPHLRDRLSREGILASDFGLRSSVNIYLKSSGANSER